MTTQETIRPSRKPEMTPEQVMDWMIDEQSMPVNGCQIWTANNKMTRHGKRRGRVMLHNGNHLSAHKLAYELTVGQVPNGQYLEHTCGNTLCIDPTHMVLRKQRGAITRRHGRGTRGEGLETHRRPGAADTRGSP